MTNLLPCPFCGSHKIETDTVRDGRKLYCAGCHVSMVSYHGPETIPSADERNAEKWNGRAVTGFSEWGARKKGALSKDDRDGLIVYSREFLTPFCAPAMLEEMTLWLADCLEMNVIEWVNAMRIALSAEVARRGIQKGSESKQ